MIQAVVSKQAKRVPTDGSLLLQFSVKVLGCSVFTIFFELCQGLLPKQNHVWQEFPIIAVLLEESYPFDRQMAPLVLLSCQIRFLRSTAGPSQLKTRAPCNKIRTYFLFREIIMTRFAQGPLYISTEHSILPLQGRGDSKNPMTLLRPIFL